MLGIGAVGDLTLMLPLFRSPNLNVIVEKEATVESVNAAFKKAATSGSLSKYLQYIDEPLVSSDFIGDPHSCSFDAEFTTVMENMVKVLGWYDNEQGYATRMGDLAAFIAKKM